MKVKCIKGGWGIKQLSPVFSPPFYFILSPTTVIPHFPHRVFGVDFRWGWGYSGGKKERYFFLSPTTTIPHFLRRKNWRYFLFYPPFYSYPPLQLSLPPLYTYSRTNNGDQKSRQLQKFPQNPPILFGRQVSCPTVCTVIVSIYTTPPEDSNISNQIGSVAL